MFLAGNVTEPGGGGCPEYKVGFGTPLNAEADKVIGPELKTEFGMGLRTEFGMGLSTEF